MKFEKYQSGSFKQQYQYKSFQPTTINHGWSWEDPGINVLLEKATRALGELNAFTLILPDVDLFIHMHIIKEANTSSRIEGTRTEMDEAELDEESILPERRDFMARGAKLRSGNEQRHLLLKMQVDLQ